MQSGSIFGAASAIAMWKSGRANGRGMILGNADVRSMATPARGLARHFAPTDAPSRASPKKYWPLYVATYEAMVNAKPITPALIRRPCTVDLSMHTGYTSASQPYPQQSKASHPRPSCTCWPEAHVNRQLIDKAFSAKDHLGQ